MKNRILHPARRLSALCGLLLLLDARALTAEPAPADTATFNAYARTVEARLIQQHRSPNAFLVYPKTEDARIREGQFFLERITPPPAETPATALLHHWRGTAFARGAHAADFERLMQNFNAYPHHFAPQVVQAKSLTPLGDHMQASLRIRQHHVITVVMDTAYDVTFGQLDLRHGYSLSQSTRIDEIDNAGTKSEQILGPKQEHGFLWRLNTYWSYEERDGGLYLQVESVSLSRAIPRGLGWAVSPYVESIPRESLDFTLRSAVTALRR